MLSFISKLNIMEQAELNKYINTEVNLRVSKAAYEEMAAYKQTNDNTWQQIETWLYTSMREHKISKERIKDIEKRIIELADEQEKLGVNNILIGESPKSKYKVLTDEDFQYILENLLHSNCFNCNKKHKNCDIFNILQKYKVPYFTGYHHACKYGYNENGGMGKWERKNQKLKQK
jgi:hypothetical protein